MRASAATTTFSTSSASVSIVAVESFAVAISSSRTSIVVARSVRSSPVGAGSLTVGLGPDGEKIPDLQGFYSWLVTGIVAAGRGRPSLEPQDARRASAGGCETRRYGRRGQRRHVVAEHLLERSDALRIERGPRLLAQQPERLLDRPGRAIDARRDQCVVDVADRQDPRLRIEVRAP